MWFFLIDYFFFLLCMYFYFLQLNLNAIACAASSYTKCKTYAEVILAPSGCKFQIALATQVSKRFSACVASQLRSTTHPALPVFAKTKLLHIAQ
jgi:hypothetical protein